MPFTLILYVNFIKISTKNIFDFRFFAFIFDADAYPQSKEHIYLIENGPLMEEVTAIDYEI